MERKEINLDLNKTTAIDFAIGMQFSLVVLFISLASLAGLVYRFEAIKNAVGL